VRLLLFSDLHVDSRTPSQSIDDRETANQQTRAAFAAVCRLASDHRVDAVCCAGNLYDDASVTDATGELLRAGFGSIEAPVFLAPGSSDPWQPSSLYQRVPWSANVDVFTTSSLSPRAVSTGITLWGAAHTQPVHAVGFLDGFQTDAPGTHIGLFHGCEREAFRGEHEEGLIELPITAPFEARQVIDSGLAHVLVGHLRRGRDDHRYTYPGWPPTMQQILPAPTRHFWPSAREVQPGVGAAAHGGAVLVTVNADGSVDREWLAVGELAPTAPTAPTAATQVAVGWPGDPQGTSQLGPDPQTPPQQWTAHKSPAQQWTANQWPTQTHTHSDVWTPALAPLPTWVDEVLDGGDQIDIPAIDPQSVMARFIQDVSTSLEADEQRRVLRAAVLALRGRLEDGGA
jgi:DNA repair protein SbcD/Mre11